MIRFGDKERRELVAKFERRQVNVKEFCRQHGISKGLIYKWRRQLKSSDKFESTNAQDFIQLNVKAASGASDEMHYQLPSLKQESPLSRPVLSSISSSFKLSKSDLAIEFASGCSLAEFDAVISIFRGDHAAK